MNNFLPKQLTFNTHGFLKLSLVSLALSLSLGVSTQANAQSPSEVEVISVPAQEAFFTEDKTPTSGKDNSNLQEKKNSGDDKTLPGVPHHLENGNHHANTANSAPITFRK